MSEDDLMQCDQCRRKLPSDNFLRVRMGWKVTKCNDCAQWNMKDWSRAGAGLKPGDDDYMPAATPD